MCQLSLVIIDCAINTYILCNQPEICQLIAHCLVILFIDDPDQGLHSGEPQFLVFNSLPGSISCAFPPITSGERDDLQFFQACYIKEDRAMEKACTRVELG